jgi:glyoxylate/hydroxypyruvate/2-ketogluconate reductase
VWPKAALAERLNGAWGAFTSGNEVIDAEVLAANPQLKVCANMSVGHNNFDLAAMTAAGVLATNAPGVLTETTADLGFALLMATARRLSEAEAFLRSGQWQRMRFDMLLGSDIHGATLGILGMGRIGQAVARRGAKGFGMKVIYHNRSRAGAEVEAELGARWVSKADLFAQADHIVIVLPYSREAHHVVGAAEIAAMKPTATLVNIGRGGLVDENALADALQAGRIRGAGLDVFEGEPKVNPRLLACRNVVLSPHIGSASPATRLAMANLAADNLIAVAQGRAPLTPLNAPPLNSVAWSVGA